MTNLTKQAFIRLTIDFCNGNSGLKKNIGDTFQKHINSIINVFVGFKTYKIVEKHEFITYFCFTV